MNFNGVKVFTATKFRDREDLGSVITRWLKQNQGIEIVSREVLQSSDSEFHCLSVVFFYRDPGV